MYICRTYEHNLIHSYVLYMYCKDKSNFFAVRAICVKIEH